MSTLERWQWVELWAFSAAIAIQIWLYHVSITAGAAWGFVVLALLGHMVVWARKLFADREGDKHL